MLALVTHVIPNAMRLLAIIASALYFYSVVGMESFAGCLSNRTLVKGSSYDVQNMYALNFDTFGASLMTSFTMLLVRKYPVLLEGTISCSHHKLWPMVYYFSFYILVVCFLLNVFVAFILAVFNEVESVQRVDDEYRKQINTEKRAKKARKARRSQGRNEQLGKEGQHGTTRYSRVSSMDSVVSVSSIGSIGSIGSISSFGGAHEPLQSRSDSQDAFSDTVGSKRLERRYSNFQSHRTLTPNQNNSHLHRSRGSIYLRGKVQDLLLRREDPYKSTPTRNGSTGSTSEPSRIILRSSGPKARDVEALMLKRHKASNSSGSNQESFIHCSDLIEQKMKTMEERQHAQTSLQQIALLLGVDVNQITINSNTNNGGGSGSGSGSGSGRRLNNGSKQRRGNLSSRSVGHNQTVSGNVRSSRSII